jgi:hypothetical protein
MKEGERVIVLIEKRVWLAGCIAFSNVYICPLRWTFDLSL